MIAFLLVFYAGGLGLSFIIIGSDPLSGVSSLLWGRSRIPLASGLGQIDSLLSGLFSIAGVLALLALPFILYISNMFVAYMELEQELTCPEGFGKKHYRGRITSRAVRRRLTF